MKESEFYKLEDGSCEYVCGGKTKNSIIYMSVKTINSNIIDKDLNISTVTINFTVNYQT